MASELATAYVKIIPSAEGIQGKITEALGGEASDAGKKAGSGFASSFGSGLKTAGVVAGAVATATAALTGAMVKGASETAAYGDNIDKMSQKMGLSAQAYQEWDAIMQHSGTSITSLQSGMKTLANAVENGNGAFERLGITQDMIAGMDNEQLFSATITALQNVDNETERTYLAGQLLGRGATELGALLNTSAEETEAMRQRVHELGGVMSDEAVKAAAGYQDSLQDMQTAFQGLSRNMLAEFLPSLTTVMDGLTEIFSGNSEGGIAMVSDGISAMVDNISETIPRVMEIGTQVIVSLIDAISANLPQLLGAGADAVLQIADGIIQNLPGILEAGLQVIVYLAQSIGESLPELIPTIVDVVLQIVDTLTDPNTLSSLIDAAIAIITGLAEGLIEALPHIIEKLPEIIGNIVAGLVENVPKIVEAGITLFVALVKNLPEIIKGIVEALPELIAGIVGGLMESLPEIIAAGIELFVALVGNLPEIISGIVSAVPEIIGAILDAIGPLADDLANFFSGIWESIQEIFAVVGKWFGNTFQSAKELAVKAWDDAEDLFGKVWDTIQDAFKAVTDWFKNTFQTAKDNSVKAWDDAKTLFGKVWDVIQDAFSTVGEWFKGTFTTAKDNAKGAWDNAKDLFGQVWDHVKEAFDGTDAWFNTTFDQAKENALNAWGNAKERFSEVWDNIKSAFSIGDALQWGKDMIQNFIDGITHMWQSLKDTVSRVAGTVRDYLGFSEPKKGPLSDFHTYAPDMIDLFASGIRQGIGTVESAIDSLASAAVLDVSAQPYDVGVYDTMRAASRNEAYTPFAASQNTMGGESILGAIYQLIDVVQSKNVDITLDGNSMASALWEPMQRQNQIHGDSFVRSVY